VKPLPAWALWLDLECTGATDDHLIVEIGVALSTTDPDLTEVASWESVVNYPGVDLRAMMDPVVVNMHTANGLLEALEKGEGGILGDVEAGLLAWLNGHVGHNTRVVLGGSGVSHFDRKFLKRYMPQLDRRLVHYSLDVGCVRRLGVIAGVRTQTEAGKDHRALTDARVALAEARLFVKIMKKGWWTP